MKHGGRTAAVSANALTRHTLTMLKLKGYHAWRQNNAAVWDPTKKVFRKNSATHGISDVIGFHKQLGTFIACEIKVGRDKLSEEQEAFISSVNSSGGIGLVIRTMDDVEKLKDL